MRKLLTGGILILIVFLGLFFFRNKSIKKTPVKSTNISQNIKQDSVTTIKSQSIFIPYWALTPDMSDLEQYDKLLYFGVGVDSTGIDKNDAGYNKLEDFIKYAPASKDKYLVLRMTDSDVNYSILEDVKTQAKIVRETMDIVKQYNFKGVVLDLELFSIFGDREKAQINDFVQQLYTATNSNSLKLSITLYGDTIFRMRPFDISTIAKYSDEILVMAYDFHKAKGEPGPNFPLSGRSKYGYDLELMVNDFIKYSDKSKITVVFGLYGYDWSVDEKKRPLKPAKASSLNEIKKNFIEKCQWKDCIVKRDKISRETEVNYVIPSIKDDFAYLDYHVVWFEDEESVQEKQDLLKSKGIESVGYWAYGYF